MISIIIASVNKQMLENVKKNIDETIGVAYEIIAFDNANSGKGICQVYNEGIAQARYDTLCFMHEDIALKSVGWGKVIVDLFERHPKIGIVGIAGSTYKSIIPTGWGSIGAPAASRSNLIQSFKYIKHDAILAHVNPDDESWSRVVAIDGVWMCARKEVTNKYRFDSETFKGFHCYDIDFCLSAGKEFDIVVSYEILINHFSDGKLDKNWMEQTLLLFYKWENQLPKSLHHLSKETIRKVEKINFRYFVKQLRCFGYDKKVAYQVLQRPRVIKILGMKYYLKFHYTILAIYHFKNKDKLQEDLIPIPKV